MYINYMPAFIAIIGKKTINLKESRERHIGLSGGGNEGRNVVKSQSQK